MYQIAICDDEISDLQHNIQLTESIMAKAGLPCSIAAYESSQTLLSDIQTGRHFDLLLLDVLMGELDGMALAAVLKKYPDTPNVVFISTDREMAMQGYRVDAKRYLPKPLDPELLREALLHCYEETRRQLKSRNQLMLPTATGHTRVSLQDIHYAETWGRGIRISLPTGQLELRMRLSELAAQLPEWFVYCHRTILVNLDYVIRISADGVELQGGRVIHVPRRALAELKQQYFDYYCEEDPL